MGERIGRRRRGAGAQKAGADIFQQGFGRLGRQVVRQSEERVLGRVPARRRSSPAGTPTASRSSSESGREQRRPARGSAASAGAARRDKLLHPLADLDDLDGAGARVRLDAPPLGPGVGVIMVTDVGQQEAGVGLVHDDAEVAVHPDRPEMGVRELLDAMELKARCRRVDLQVEGRGLERPFAPGRRRRASAAVKVAAIRKSICASRR